MLYAKRLESVGVPVGPDGKLSGVSQKRLRKWRTFVWRMGFLANNRNSSMPSMFAKGNGRAASAFASADDDHARIINRHVPTCT
jgi:hypothetical protein